MLDLLGVDPESEVVVLLLESWSVFDAYDCGTVCCG